MSYVESGILFTSIETSEGADITLAFYPCLTLTFQDVCADVPRFTEKPSAAAAPDVKEEEEAEEEEGPDVKPELPLHMSLTKDVMERCVHLLSHPNMGVRLKVENIKEH